MISPRRNRDCIRLLLVTLNEFDSGIALWLEKEESTSNSQRTGAYILLFAMLP